MNVLLTLPNEVEVNPSLISHRTELAAGVELSLNVTVNGMQPVALSTTKLITGNGFTVMVIRDLIKGL